MRLALSAIAAALLAACTSQPDYRASDSTPPTVPSVDLDRYAGLWYEIARYPNGFERNCTGVTAEYGLNSDGTVLVTNTCFKGSLDGEKTVAEGKAPHRGGGWKQQAESEVCACMGSVRRRGLLGAGAGAGLFSRPRRQSGRQVSVDPLAHGAAWWENPGASEDACRRAWIRNGSARNDPAIGTGVTILASFGRRTQ